MSRARKRDNYTPSLFPFLAVLLCTMGALVLLLMLIVSQAQASAKQMAVDKKQRVEEVEDQLELARDSFERELNDRRLDLERKRLALQHLEKHIQELLAEMQEIEQTAKLLNEKQTDEELTEAETKRKLSELEEQLANATKDLKQKLDKPDGDKPIFAIIPYQGTNGTHRRPIYLECIDKGVIIQPEGILIGLTDLRPPSGPGNPLDAALRTIRSRYMPANGALTSTAYPLLVVRPSGIRSYAMARQAMSGWDDQFGYELIDEELELAFPESQPGLAADIEKALVLARERQAALIMAMPQKYRQFINAAGRGDQFEFAEDDGGFGDDWVSGSAGTGQPGSNRQAGANGNSSLGGSNGSRGGFSTNGSEAVAGGVGGDSAMSGSAMGIGAQRGSAGDSLQYNSAGNPDNNYASNSSNSEFGSEFSAGGESFFNNGSSRQTASGAAMGADQSQSNSVGGSVGTGGTSSEQGGNAADGADGTSASASAGGTSQPASGLRATSGATGSSAGTAAQSGQSGMAGASASGGSSSSAGGNGQQSAQGTPPDASMDPNQNFSPSMNFDMSSKQTQKSTPVAASRGRNWAWADGPPTKTAVVRSIRVVCYTDRWVVMPDAGSNANQITIPIGDTPQSSAEKLAKTVTDRVSTWGIALSGGYWKPEIAVDVAPDAEARYQQLLRLLEGSGLVVQRRSATN